MPFRTSPFHATILKASYVPDIPVTDARKVSQTLLIREDDRGQPLLFPEFGFGQLKQDGFERIFTCVSDIVVINSSL